MRVLIVRLRQIGDVVFTTPAVRRIREHHPHAHIAYLVEPAAAPVVAGNPSINEVIVAPRVRGVRGLFTEWALIRRLRAGRYDLVIDFHGGPRASILTWLSGAPVRVGYDIPGRAWMYTRRVARPRALRPRHSVENQADLLSALDIPSAPPAPPAAWPVEMRVDPEAARAVASRLAVLGVYEDHQLVVMHVSAGNPFRRWPLISFATVAARLASSGEQRRIIVTSGPSEADAARSVIDEARATLGAASSRILPAADFSLAELRALVDRAALYIGGDSGPLHIAATSQVPIVGLYGPTLPVRSAPWRSSGLVHIAVETTGLPCRPCDQRDCAPGDFRCLTWIMPEQVVEAAEQAMARARR
jgi:lipopolysaccharide heptosyltransferase II